MKKFILILCACTLGTSLLSHQSHATRTRLHEIKHATDLTFNWSRRPTPGNLTKAIDYCHSIKMGITNKKIKLNKIAFISMIEFTGNYLNLLTHLPSSELENNKKNVTWCIFHGNQALDKLKKMKSGCIVDAIIFNFFRYKAKAIYMDKRFESALDFSLSIYDEVKESKDYCSRANLELHTNRFNDHLLKAILAVSYCLRYIKWQMQLDPATTELFDAFIGLLPPKDYGDTEESMDKHRFKLTQVQLDKLIYLAEQSAQKMKFPIPKGGIILPDRERLGLETLDALPLIERIEFKFKAGYGAYYLPSYMKPSTPPPSIDAETSRSSESSIPVALDYRGALLSGLPQVAPDSPTRELLADLPGWLSFLKDEESEE